MPSKKAFWFLFATLLCLVACGRVDDKVASSTELALVPVFSGLSPSSGPAGTPVIITGSGFTGTNLVAFSDRPGPEIVPGKPALFNVDNDSQITAVVPPGSTTGPILIRNIDGETWTSSFTVTSTAAPTVSAFNPLSGGPGVSVTVTGAAFTGATNVAFNGVPATFYLVDDGMLVADVPSAATTGFISVTNTVGAGASPSSFVLIPPPIIDGFSPQSGQPGGFITLTGTGFTGATEVRFGMGSGGSAAFQVSNDNQIVAQVPLGAGSGPIFVTTPGGTSSTPGVFTVLSLAAPTISGFSPMTGGVGSFTRISGSNFTGTSTVSFNGTPSSAFYIEDDASLAAYVPSGATTGPITVTNNIGSATSADVFTVIPAPWIAGFLPTAGASGDTVVITGGGFTGTYAVYIGWGSPGALFTVDNDSQITATVPQGTVTGPLRIEAPGGMVESLIAFTVLPSTPPTVSSFSPGSGSTGQSVTVYGSGFAGVASVTFSGVPASFNLRNASELEAWVPFGATSGPISVTNSLGTGTSTTSFTVIPPPAITGFAPSSGQPGDSVVITGSGFTGATQVIFGGGGREPVPPSGGGGTSAAFTVDNDGQITATVPVGARTGIIAVGTPGGWAESPGMFTVLSTAPPVISSFNPMSGGEGRSVTVLGSSFTGTTNVAFNGVPAIVSLLGDTEITTYVPKGATTGPISVTNTLGTTLSASDFTVIPPPTIASFSPSSGQAGNGVIITGSGFTGATEVVFGSTRDPLPGGGGGGQALFTVDGDTQISAIVPSGIESGPISVRTPGGFAESAQSFTVLSSAPPVLTSFSPAGGGERSSVRLLGAGFTGTTDVSFAGTPANFSVLSDGEIMTFVPIGATTGPITVTNTLGTATSATSFTLYPPPTIAGFAPGSGAAGTTVVISGMGFTGTMSVTFATSVYSGSGGGSGGGEPPRPGGGGAGSATFTVDSDAQITAIVPPGTVTGSIEVMTQWGYAISATSFIVESSSAPNILGFSPTTGGRGTAVTLWGSGFTGTTAVAFGGIPSTSFWLNSDGSLTAVVPDGALTGPIGVTNTLGSATSSQSFTVIPPPAITSFSPTMGQPGSTVVITGSGFSAARDVWFGGGALATFVVDSDAQITATVPSGAQTGPIEVRTPYGSASSAIAFTVLSTSPPSVSGFSPSSGMPGTRVTVTGSGFSGVTSVLFNSMGAWGFNVLGDTALEAVVPVGAATGPITVVNTLGSASSTTDFVVLPGPMITGFSPSSGEVGDSVVITGSGFTGVEMVRFGEAWAWFTVDSDTQITVAVPDGALTGPIEVAGTESAEIFTVLSSGPPTITGFSPASGSVGSFTRLSGTNLTGATQVLFNGTPSTSFGVEGGGSLYAYVPPGARTGPITVTNTVGSATSSADFTVVPPPTFTGFSPPSGSPGDSVVLTGTGFLGVSSVRFGGGMSASFVVDSDTQITATVPFGAATGPIELNNSVQSATEFVVLSTSAPVIAGFSPGSGGAGAEVTITGFGFAGTTAVSFGSVPAWFEARSDTTIIARVPIGAATGPITVENNVGTATSAASFVILPPPTVSSFFPTSGAAGDTVLITGTGFTGVTRVEFGLIQGIAASFTVLDDTQINATVPVGAITGPIRVEGPTGTVTSATSFTVVATAPPTIVSFNPPSGGVGLIVHLTGAGFTGTSAVSFGGVAATAFATRSDTELDAVVPVGAVTAPITVVNAAGGATSPTDFVVDAASGMWITDVSPSAGTVGMAVVITGTNLGGAQVQFADSVQATVLADTGTSLIVTVPAGAKTGWIIVFRDPDGQGGPDQVAIWPLFTVYVAACGNAPAGTPCGLCAVCDSTGACAAPAVDDSACGTVDCDALDQTCGDYHDLVAARCEGVGDCKDANTSDCTSVSAAPAGADCGTCSSCDGQGTCADDLAQDADCPPCQECAASGACGAQANGTACDDGDGCTMTDACQAGACSGSNPVVCTALDACHVVGVCDPATGTCSNPLAAGGTPCDDGRSCTSADACEAGMCLPGPSSCACTTDADCFPIDQCHVAGTCNVSTGQCSNPSAIDGRACNDGDVCTSGETCQAGICGAPIATVSCSALDDCHDAGVCDPATGLCTNPAKPNDTLCSDGIACTEGDSCQAGACVPSSNLCPCATDADCPARDQCHVAGTCDPVTRLCTSGPAPDSTPCDDADACTFGETCQAGSCGAPSSTVVCAAPDECEEPGVCDPATGACSWSPRPDQTPCAGGACQAGQCTPTLGVGSGGADGGGPDGASPDAGPSGSGGTTIVDGSSSSDAGSLTAGTTGAGGAADGATSMPGDAESDAGEGSPVNASGDDSGCGCRLARAANPSAPVNPWLLFTVSVLLLRSGTWRRRHRAAVSPFERR